MKDGYYYLHTNGDMIYKPAIVVDSDPEYFNSPFVAHVWPVDLKDRANAWRIATEGLALGAKVERIKELAEKWKLTAVDAVEYVGRTPEPTELQVRGLGMFFQQVLGIDIDKFVNKSNEFFKQLKDASNN